MSSVIAYDFVGVGTAGEKFSSINGLIDTNNADLKGVADSLLDFTGDSAQAWSQQSRILLSKLADYTASLVRLRGVIVSECATGGNVQAVDNLQGQKFLAIGI